MPKNREHSCHRCHRVLNYLCGIGIKRLVVYSQILSAVIYTAAFAFLAILQFCDPSGQDLDQDLLPILRWFHKHRFTIACWLIGLTLFFQTVLWLAKKADRLPVNKVEKILDDTCARFFPTQTTEEHVYRATLFKARGFSMTGSWLSGVARSGHTYKRIRTVFSIDCNSKQRNTGVAGECWRMGGKTIIMREALPETRTDVVDGMVREKYEKDGFVTAAEYDLMSVRSRVFLATGIRVRGRLWGILILDSTDENALKWPARTAELNKVQKERKLALEHAAMMVGLLLEED